MLQLPVSSFIFTLVAVNPGCLASLPAINTSTEGPDYQIIQGLGGNLRIRMCVDWVINTVHISHGGEASSGAEECEDERDEDKHV